MWQEVRLKAVNKIANEVFNRLHCSAYFVIVVVVVCGVLPFLEILLIKT